MLPAAPGLAAPMQGAPGSAALMLSQQPAPAQVMSGGEHQPAYPAGTHPAHPPASPPGPPRRNLPPEVLLVTIGLLVVAGLMLYPVVRYGFPLIGDLFNSSDFVRALGALVLFVFVTVGGAGIAIALLAIGVSRGSRVAQLLTCLLCVIVGIGELIEAGDSQNSFGAEGPSHTTAAVVALVCGLIVALLTLPSTARSYFAADHDRPVGVVIGTVVAIYYGACMALDGMLLMLCGVVGAKFVWWGIGLVAGGLGLLASGRYLQAGRSAARLLVAGALSLCVIMLFVVSGSGTGGPTFFTVVPLLLAIVAVGGLTIPTSSQAHFRQPQPVAPLNALPATAFTILIVLAVIFASIGFASSRPSLPASSGGPVYVPTHAPTYAPAPATYSAPAPTLAASDAESAVDEALNGLVNGGMTPTDCNGDPLGLTSGSSYSVGDVVPSTLGDFTVSANLTLDNGSVEVVEFDVASDSAGQACLAGAAVEQPSAAAPAEPPNVPNVPSANEPVAEGVAPPEAPTSSDVVPYTDSNTWPTNATQLVEWEPQDGLSANETAAVRDIIGFMVRINQQHFQAAWDLTTETKFSATAQEPFRHGYRTSHFYQVAFGQPRTLAADLTVVPARFVSRQDPSAQGNPSGVTDCTYWPQYVFVVGLSGGKWLVDVARSYDNRHELRAIKRVAANGTRQTNPSNQRVSC